MLKQYREEIDKIDKALIPLLVSRMDATQKVGLYKKEHQLPVYDPAREQEVIRSKQEQAGRYQEEIRALYEAIMSVSRQGQQTIIGPEEKPAMPQHVTAVYMGVAGSYGEEAANRLFGSDLYPLETFQKVFEAVESGRATYGVLPIENSSTGSINEVYDLFKQHNVSITHQTTVAVDHVLLGVKGAKLEDVTEVYSHEQGLSQCREFLAGHGLKQVPYHNTAVAAKFVSQTGNKQFAAIAARRNAQLYNLDILADNICFGAKNATRFIAISKTPTEDVANNKNSILFTLPHTTGALASVLNIFSRCGLNLLKLESRPVVDRFGEYVFFLDFSGNKADPNVQAALTAVQEAATSYRYLGNYAE